MLRGKGFGGLVEPLPLGYDDEHYSCGEQSLAGGRLRLTLVGRMVPEKGVCDAVRVLASLHVGKGIDAELVLAGSGPELTAAMALAKGLGVDARVEHRPWLATPDLAQLYRETHVVLAPSRSTATWAEQFGRMIVEGAGQRLRHRRLRLRFHSRGRREPGVAGSGRRCRLPRRGRGARPERSGGVPSPKAIRTGPRPRENMDLRRPQAGRVLPGWLWTAGRTPLLAGSPRARRRLAEAEFGRPAQALGQSRPFALPYLRRPSATSRVLGRTMDMLAEVRTKIRRAG